MSAFLKHGNIQQISRKLSDLFKRLIDLVVDKYSLFIRQIGIVIQMFNVVRHINMLAQ